MENSENTMETLINSLQPENMGGEDAAPKVFSHNFGSFSGKKCDLGIDEAGRGPVLGPMVYGCGILLHNGLDDLKQLGVDDSKALNEEKRKKIFKKFSEPSDPASAYFGYALQILPAQYLDNQSLKRVKVSLNEVSHTAAIDLIQACVDSGILVQNVFVDTVGKADIYQEKLQRIFPNLSITVAVKADSLYPVVSAASICAKVTRDRLLQNWKFLESGIEVPEEGYGSGYPGDPNTIRFMEESIENVFGYPSLVRFSWKTTQTLLESKAVKVKWEDDESSSKGSKSLMNFFSKSKDPPTIQRHAYFVDRNLQSATTF